MPRKRTTPLQDNALEPGHCSPELRRRILGSASYFRGLSPEALDAVNAWFREQHYPADGVICREGAEASRLYFVAHGKVKLVRHGPAGDDVVLDLLAPGELFGGVAATGARHHRETAIAQTECCVLRITADAFEGILEHYQDVALRVLHTVARELDEARESIRQLAVSPVEARIATALLKLSERFGEVTDDGLLIQSPLPQQDIAAMVGATQETVSRTMAAFRRSGLISTGRQWVAIRDRGRLRAISGT